jgi:NAD(P)-dependent dehydrogenase (short-subunit alcohol dehydrogenase family)
MGASCIVLVQMVDACAKYLGNNDSEGLNAAVRQWPPTMSAPAFMLSIAALRRTESESGERGMFKDDMLRGAVAYVAGGTSGINLGIAKAYARAGASVALVGRNAAKAAAAAAEITDEGGRAIWFAADVRDYDAVAETLQSTRDQLGLIDIVISGAAGNFPASAVNLSSKGFKTVVEIDLIGTYHVFRASFDHIKKPGASLIAISAPNAVHPMPFQIHPCAAKAGVNMVVKVLALEWGPAGIRVNGISPGPIKGTEGASERLISAERQEGFIKRIPLRRFGTLQEIANAALFLGSDLSSYTTGHILDCEGGSALGEASMDALAVTPRP